MAAIPMVAEATDAAVETEEEEAVAEAAVAAAKEAKPVTPWPKVSVQLRNGQPAIGYEVWRGLCPISQKETVVIQLEGKPVEQVTNFGPKTFTTYYLEAQPQYVRRLTESENQ